eukprot:767575-Hanusia_phi.AAC.3
MSSSSTTSPSLSPSPSTPPPTTATATPRVDHAGLAKSLAEKSRMMNYRVKLHGAASPLHHAASLGLTHVTLLLDPRHVL